MAEEVVFQSVSKLYRFDNEVDNEWKERGTGELVILKNEEGYYRIVARREQTLKICASFYIHPEGKLSKNPTQKYTWVVSCNDFSDEVSKLTLFALRFKTEADFEKFSTIYEEGRESMIKITKALEETAETKEVEEKKDEPKETEQAEQVEGGEKKEAEKEPVVEEKEPVVEEKEPVVEDKKEVPAE
ncbi:hypothetical protein ADUPG1_006731 [Aduncisulcus paluster]|uniref:RanBD1 domain-containing protein n=2 Tax=Aduncisulcus paluster TaxID=2918883 RepID=A0ABQ5KKY5_9EUKA|nr:hypothetical protein ADUPG1_011595 [Aduncisulcus paluster]GKT32626.1 hypothetical protein ADUPG1_006731 [Aduncisulcus paluster]|eukprot:gnl/Carplike_NY0171/354_a492_3980.p1 GENE.gnl/Carplike_NY0171/354_a492_3980~~gnl/Carplike_NY0171/354_a492_3980.p1  ORF type:complete len:187 (-),score=75.13 gnl/Carplike_NY0171/354_a492_3980:40-600(-)